MRVDLLGGLSVVVGIGLVVIGVAVLFDVPTALSIGLSIGAVISHVIGAIASVAVGIGLLFTARLG